MVSRGHFAQVMSRTIWYRYRTGSNTSSNWSVGVNVFEWPSPTAPLPLHTPDGITHIVAANVSDLRRVLAAKHGYSAEEAADELVHVFKCSLNEETRQLLIEPFLAPTDKNDIDAVKILGYTYARLNTNLIVPEDHEHPPAWVLGFTFPGSASAKVDQALGMFNKLSVTDKQAFVNALPKEFLPKAPEPVLVSPPSPPPQATHRQHTPPSSPRMGPTSAGGRHARSLSGGKGHSQSLTVVTQPTKSGATSPLSPIAPRSAIKPYGGLSAKVHTRDIQASAHSIRGVLLKRSSNHGEWDACWFFLKQDESKHDHYTLAMYKDETFSDASKIQTINMKDYEVVSKVSDKGAEPQMPDDVYFELRPVRSGKTYHLAASMKMEDDKLGLYGNFPPDAIKKMWVSRLRHANAPHQTFGLPLELHLKNTNTKIPAIMDLCIKEITDRESTPGLYREPGSELIISAIKSKFDSKEAAKISLFADPSPGAKVTVQDVASLLKAYLRELPEPLFTFEFCDKVKASMAKNGANNLESATDALKEHISSLREPNKTASFKLINHLREVVLTQKQIPVDANGHQRSLDEKALATCIAPTIVNFTSGDKVADIHIIHTIVHALILKEDVIPSAPAGHVWV